MMLCGYARSFHPLWSRCKVFELSITKTLRTWRLTLNDAPFFPFWTPSLKPFCTLCQNAVSNLAASTRWGGSKPPGGFQETVEMISSACLAFWSCFSSLFLFAPSLLMYETWPRGPLAGRSPQSFRKVFCDKQYLLFPASPNLEFYTSP